MGLKSHTSRNTERTAGTDLVVDAKVKGEANSRFTADANGKLRWGPGGGTALDTTLERTAASKLKLTGALEVTTDLTIASLSGVLKASAGAVTGSATTTDLTEGTNLYYTQARFDTALAGKTTANLTEGSNLYYTDGRVDTRITGTWRGLANGLASLDSGGKIPTSQLPALAITDTFIAASQAAMLALTAETGDVAVRTDISKSFILAGTDPSILAHWQELLTPTDAVLSVNGQTGAVTLTTSHINEGSNLYYTDARVRACTLTGLNTALTGAVAATDTILQGFGRLEYFRALITTRGDLLYYGASGPQRLALGAANNLLRSDGTDAVWAKVNLPTDVTGILDPINGGTGADDSPVAGDVLVSSFGDIYDNLPGNTTATRKFFRSVGNGSLAFAPAWDTLTADDIPALAASKITSGQLIVAQGGTGLATTQANKVFSGRSDSGADLAPTWRYLVDADIPVLDASKINTGQLLLARGGTGANLSSATTNSLIYKGASVLEALAPSDGFLRRNGAAPHWHQITGWNEPSCFSTDRIISSADALEDVANVLATLISDLRAGKILSA